MIAVFAIMLMTGAPMATPNVSVRAPVAQPAPVARTSSRATVSARHAPVVEGRRQVSTHRQSVSRQAAAPARRMHPPVIRYEVLGDLPATLREPTLCAAHMELLIEKVSAAGEDVQTPVLLIQEYWQARLPDPDGDAAISDDIFSRLKATLDASARSEPELYLRQVQGCVTEAAAAGALD